MALLALASSAFQVYAQSNMTVSGKIEGKDRKSTRLNSSHGPESRMPSSA